MSKILNEYSTSYKPADSNNQKSTTSRKLTVAYQHNHVDRPMIRMAGLWLREAGFQIGDPIEIDVSPDRLNIRKMV